MTSFTRPRTIWLFPAYAGVIPELLAMYYEQLAFPRIRGGDPVSYTEMKIRS